ncbi:MAG: hypothetical protein Q4C95_12040 [Planctomycetia bacterium]|nr:hypothetical protein [Planctomycetia bacterium]
MINIYNASDWPVRGFWIRNKTRNDLCYVDYRSGNALYTKDVVWGVMTFAQGRLEIRRGTTIGNNA